MPADAWVARWCWTPELLTRPWNTYVFFRKSLDLPAKPRRALVRVSADARYTLYVNARRIHFGPARFAPDTISYDTLDLAPFFHEGPNVVAAVVHQFGIPTFQSVYRAVSGFLLDGIVESDHHPAIGLHTPEGWLARPAKGWRKDVARLSFQLGFQEHVDADADPANWLNPDYTAAESDGWRPASNIGPVGKHPWLTMEDRAVPLLTDHIHPIPAVTAIFRGENARGYKIADDVYSFAQSETRKRDKSVLSDPANMLRDDDAFTLVQEPADGEFIMAVLDLGTYRTGHLMLDIADAHGDEIIDILYTEDVDKSGAPAFATERTTADRYRCRPGPQQWESFHLKGMRYVTLIFRNAEKPLMVRRVAVRQVHADLPTIGAFECSDERLTRIFQTGIWTQLNCAFDAFVDCPGREFAQWWGDARIQSRVAAFAFGDSSLLARGIRQMAQSQAADGALVANPPTDAVNHLPDFMLAWIGTLWDYYFLTARSDLVAQCLPTMHRMLDLFRRHERTDDHLIGDFDGFWVFLDWAELYKTNFSAVLNLMYLIALRHAADLCDLVQDPAATRYRDTATTLAASVESHFFDCGDKVWRDGFDPATGKAIESVSQHANALAILADLKPDTHQHIARHVLLKSATSKRTKVVTGTPFFYAYILDALTKAGLRAESIQIIRDKWGAMLDAGATTFWEHWHGNASRCHAWSASPVYHLAQLVLGITPTAPGWKRIAITPTPATLDFARGTVASPLGPIRVEWEKVTDDQLALRIDLPEGLQADFTDPRGQTRILEAGAHEFST